MNLTDVNDHNIEAALTFVQNLCMKSNNNLDPRELKLFECALRGITVDKCHVAYRSCFTDSIYYTKTTISPSLWRKVSQAIHEEICLFRPNFPYYRLNKSSIWSSLKSLIEAKHQITEKLPLEPKLYQVPQLEPCYGRGDDITILEKYVLQERKRGVFIIGLAGIGKATLVNQFIHERVLTSNRFSHIFWCPVRHTNIVDCIYQILKHFHPVESRESLINRRSNSTATQIEAHLINELVEVLQHHSILLVFPDWCSLFTDQESSTYLPEAQGYKQLLDILLRRRHHSCVLVLSSQLPELHHQIQPGLTSNISSVVVRGLDTESAQELLINQLPDLELSSENMAALTELVQQYGGHPSALIHLADIIDRSFHNNIQALLQQQTIILDHPLEQLLAHQFQRWEPLERKLLFHLALACRALTQSELHILCFRQIPNSTLLNRLRKLFDRGIVYISYTSDDQTTPRYFLEPIVQKYLQNRFIEICSQEILELAEDPQPQRLTYLNDYYLVESNLKQPSPEGVSVDITHQQQQVILERIFFPLNSAWKTIDIFQTKLGQIMDLVASRSWVLSGYAQHNLEALLSLSNNHEFLSRLL